MAQQFAMRKNVKGTTPFAGSGACTTTVIAFTISPTSDPLIRIPLEQLDTGYQTWLGTTREQRHDTRFTWQRHLSTHLATGKPLSSMGPAAGSINAVLLVGWLPSRPDLWHLRDGTSIQIGNKPFSRFQLIARAQDDLQRQVWARASQHQHGSGLETGIPSFEAVRKTIKSQGP